MALVPISSMAKRYGVRCMIYGPPGEGKTPLIETCPNPVLFPTEPGLMSIRHLNNVPMWISESMAKEKRTVVNAKDIEEFFKKFLNSKDAAGFQTIFVDSFTHLAEIVLADCEKRIKHGLKAYGEMSRTVYGYANQLNEMMNMNVVLIAKEGSEFKGVRTNPATGIQEDIIEMRPLYPGNDLKAKMPHLFDLILHLRKVRMPGVPGEVRALRAIRNEAIFARDRSGLLQEFNEPDLGKIFNLINNSK